jgi:protein gp37
MGKNTLIEWCDSTVNPVMACQGCELWTSKNRTCYAGTLTERHELQRAGKIKKASEKGEVYDPWNGKDGWPHDFDTPLTFEGRMEEAASYSDLRGRKHSFRIRRKRQGKTQFKMIRKPWLDGLARCIFVSDMGDALSKTIDFDFLEREVIRNVVSQNGSRHIWMWLTKRPERMAEFSRYLLNEKNTKWPQNLWAMTSVTKQSTAVSRIPHLFDVGDETTIRGLSVEPLWEKVTLSPWINKLDWVIVGGESGDGEDRKLMNPEWARELLGECTAARVPFFLKQMGGSTSVKGGKESAIPKDLYVRKLPRRTTRERVRDAGKTFRKVWVNIPVERGLAAKLTALAEKNEVSRRDLVGEILREKLAKLT